MKKQRVVVLVHKELIPPDSLDGIDPKEREKWQLRNVEALLGDIDVVRAHVDRANKQARCVEEGARNVRTEPAHGAILV